MKTLENIIEKHNNKVGFFEQYSIPKTVINGWFGEIHNCIAYIDLLGLINVASIISDLKNSGLKMKIYGRDIYIIK